MNPFYYIFRTVELLSLYCIYNMSNTNVRALWNWINVARLYFTWSTYMYIVLISFRFDHLKSKKKKNSVRAADRYYTKVKEQKTLQTTLLDNAFLQPEDQCSRLIEINNIVYYLSIQIILYAILFCCCCCWFFNTAVICIH